MRQLTGTEPAIEVIVELLDGGAQQSQDVKAFLQRVGAHAGLLLRQVHVRLGGLAHVEVGQGDVARVYDVAELAREADALRLVAGPVDGLVLPRIAHLLNL